MCTSKVVVDYNSSHDISTLLEITLRISNSLGYAKDVEALFNMHGQRPGEDGHYKFIYDREQSNGKESVFVTRINMEKIGYRTFVIRLKLNDVVRYVKYDPEEECAVLTGMESHYSFWEVVTYLSDYVLPDRVRGGIMYQIYVDTFASDELPEKMKAKTVDWFTFPKWRPDPDGEYRNNQYYGGNLRGIINKLDYIKSLGTTVIYLTPIFKGNSAHRYDTVDYTMIDEIIGTWAQVDELHKEANARDMDLVVDAVFNHSSNENPLIKEVPHMYDWIDGKIKTWWGYKTLCEFNKFHPRYYIELAKWLSLYQMYFDGLRLDVADNMPVIVLKFIKATLRKYLLGEIWKDPIKGEYKEYILGACLDGHMNYRYTNAIYRYIIWGKWRFFKKVIRSSLRLYPPPALMGSPIFMTSHDIPRMRNILLGYFMKESESYENVWDMEKDPYWLDSRGNFDTLKFRSWEAKHDKIPDDKKALVEEMVRITVFLQYTLPGLPSIFAGDEAGATGYKDPFNRKPFPWNNIDKDSYNLYKTMGKFRIGYRNVFSSYDFEFISINSERVVYKRENLIFIVNRSGHNVDVSSYVDGNVIFGVGNYQNKTLAPRSAIVVENFE